MAAGILCCGEATVTCGLLFYEVVGTIYWEIEHVDPFWYISLIIFEDDEGYKLAQSKYIESLTLVIHNEWTVKSLWTAY